MIPSRLELAQLIRVSLSHSLTLFADIEQNAAVPQAYQDTNKPIAESQFVLGGLRLAYLMTTIFPNTIIEEETLFLA
jgi:hypothetical protein